MLATPIVAGAKGDTAPKPSWRGRVMIEEGYNDNVRADAVARLEAFYTTLQGETWWRRSRKGWLPHRIGGLVRGRIYSRYSNRDFAEFGPRFGYDWKRLSLTLDYRFSPDHLRVDPAATADAFANVHDLSGQLRSKFGKNKRWLATLELLSEWEFYDPSYRERSFFEETVEAGLRCRATRRITPRVGLSYSSRDAISSNYDREDISVLFGVDLYLPAGVRTALRYEKGWRNFLVGYERDEAGDRNNNFGREDDVDTFSVTLNVPVPRVESATMSLLYRYRDNRSSREDRSYDVNQASLRLVYDF